MFFDLLPGLGYGKLGHFGRFLKFRRTAVIKRQVGMPHQKPHMVYFFGIGINGK